MKTYKPPVCVPSHPLYPLWHRQMIANLQEETKEEVKEVRKEDAIDKMTEGDKFIAIEVLGLFFILLFVILIKDN